MRPFWLSIFAACVLSLISSPAHAVLLSNGDFETPTVPVGGFTNFNSGSTLLTGWTVVGRQVSIVSGTFTQNGISFPAENGTQWLDLTGDNSNSSEGVEQSVPTTPGADYSLSLWVGNVTNPDGIFGITSTVDVLIDGTQLLAAENSGFGTTAQVWQQFTVPFTAKTSGTTVEFLNADPPNDNTNGLDNITLTQTGGGATAIPLPSAAWSALAMLGGLLLARLFARGARPAATL
jgi:hypothetical protein